MLYSTHAMLAALVSVEEIALKKDEADTLAKSIANVTRHYNIPEISSQTIDWIMLIQTVGVIYGTRVMAYNLRTRQHRAASRPSPPEPGVVVAVPSPSVAPPANPPPNGGGTARHSTSEVTVDNGDGTFTTVRVPIQ